MTSSRDALPPVLVRWWPFLIVVAAYAIVTLQQITLPGVYMDAVNPDYMAARLLNPKGEVVLPWLLPGNWLFNRAPIMISYYHGSQPMWLGLPFFWLFGMTVTGLRLTHAMFALGVLAALYAFLGRSGMKPWQAALACIALAIDPSFSYAFRTQSYITLAPAAWLFLSLYSSIRGGEGGRRHLWWLFASGLLYGFAVVAYFIYFFFLPALLLAVWWSPQPARTPKAWSALVVGVVIGAIWYPIGYALTVSALGGFAQAWDYFQQTQRTINAFSQQTDLSARVAHLIANLRSVFHNSYHHALIFGEYGEVPGAHYKMGILVTGSLLLWARAEWYKQAGALRVLVALGVSFVLIAMFFGTRLSGHHFMVLLPIAYGALALGLVALAKGPPAWRIAHWTIVVPFAALIGLNIGGQVKEGQRLADVRGVGLYSDAINRLARDLDANPRKPFVYFPDWGLLMPVAFLTAAASAWIRSRYIRKHSGCCAVDAMLRSPSSPATAPSGSRRGSDLSRGTRRRSCPTNKPTVRPCSCWPYSAVIATLPAAQNRAYPFARERAALSDAVRLADANHRYMTDKTVRSVMAAKGWLIEGDGPDAVVMCAPTS